MVIDLESRLAILSYTFVVYLTQIFIFFFQDYSRSVEHKGYSMYNSGDLRTMKQEFKSMVEDKFDKRMNHG